MKTIFIDARFADRKDGTGRVTYNLTRALLLLDKKNRYIISAPEDDFFHDIPHEEVLFRRITWGRRGAGRVVWDIFVLPALLLWYRADIYYAFEAFMSPVIFKGKIILTIHDLIPLERKDYYTKILNRLWFFFRVHIATRQIHETITVSEYTKSAVEKMFPQLKGHLYVIYNALDERLTAFAKTDAAKETSGLLPHTYILGIGGLEERKNNALTIKAFIKVADTIDPSISLAIIGAGNDAHKNVSHNADFAIPPSLEKRICFLQHVTDEQLCTLFTNASLFAFPTTYEGFGMPILEAMFYRTPVIAVNTPVSREVGADACLYIENTVGSMADAILSILRSTALQKSLIEKGGKNLTRFSWKQGAEQLLRIFDA